MKYIILAKTLTWRIIASGITFLIIYLLTKKVKDAGIMMLIDTISKTLFYYGHEKLWSKCERKSKEEKSEIELNEINVNTKV